MWRPRHQRTDHAPDPPPERLRRAERVLRDRTGDLTILLEDPYDPGNLSAVLRTVEALGVQEVHVVREAAWHVRRRVTQRADRWLTVHRWRRLEPALNALREGGFRIMVAGLGREVVPLRDVDPRGRVAVAFGNESAGVSTPLRRAADGEFWIPTLGFTGSLNLSVAVGITLWELRRRQIALRGVAGDLPEAHLHTLRERWYRSLARGRPDRERAYQCWLGGVEPAAADGPPDDRRRPAGPATRGGAGRPHRGGTG